MQALLQDLRYAVRILKKNLGFTIAVVLTFAFGIGCTAAVFTFVDSLLLRKLPVRSPEQLVAVSTPGRNLNLNPSYFSHAFYQHLRGSSQIFSHLVATSVAVSSGINLREGNSTDRVRAELVSGNYFNVLGVGIAAGRAFSEDDDRVPGAHPVILLSHAFWQRRFNGSPKIVGRTISLNGYPFTVIGVASPDFFGVRPGFGPDLWAPIMMVKQVSGGGISPNTRDQNYLELMARIEPGVNLQEARAAIKVIYQSWLDSQSAARQPGDQGSVKPFLELTQAPRGISRLRGEYSQPLIVLMTFVGLLLLLTCANVSMLVLARATTRVKEIAIRLSVGASRIRLIRQLMTECLLLGGLGGALGWFLSIYLGHAILFFLPDNSQAWQFAPNARVLLFTMVISVLTGSLLGLTPALVATRTDLIRALKSDTGYMGGTARRLGLREALSAIQVAISLLLVIGAALFLRTLHNLKSMDMGFRSENVLLASLDPAKSGYDRQKIVSFFDQLVQRIRQQPGIIEVGLASHGSLSGVLPSGMRFFNTTMHAEGYGATSGDEMNFYNNFVTPGYFPAVGIQILQGRNFDQRDHQGSGKVAIVNKVAARHWFKGEDPIGKRIGMGMSGPTDIEIVGVVQDAKYVNVREKALRTVYLPFHQAPGSPMTMHIKTTVDPRTVSPIVQREVRALDTNIPIFQVQTMSARIDDALSQERLITTLATVLAVLGTLLATIGLYGVVSYSAIQRTREIGIRIALGAQHTDLLKLVIGQGMKLALIGLTFGLAAAVALTRLVNSLLYGVSATDPLTFGFIVLLLTGIALVACYIPARRAAKVDPIVALHSE